jgi:hypothetical protein
LVLVCFWLDFFWFDLGDLSPINIDVLRIDFPAAYQFLSRGLHHVWQSDRCK